MNRDNVKWAGRTTLIIVLVAVAEGLVGAFANKPFPWVAMIPGFIPVLIAVFVSIPMMHSEKAAE